MTPFYKALVASLGLLLGTWPLVGRAEFVDVLDMPSLASPLAQNSPLQDLAQAGKRLVAVGQRGHILYSDDGQNWQQAQVPVSSDLNAVYFSGAQRGWAVGHDGVILHSEDAGATWSKQLDGRLIGTLMGERYAALAAAEPGNPEWAQRLDEAQRMTEEGADKPLLDVWFENERVGYAVGVFNLILRTEDGGQHWQPFGEHTDNPQGLHLNAIAAVDGVPFIVGEQGLLLRWNEAQQRFVALQSPYAGSFFGLIGQGHELLVYGLRGHVLRSTDGGANWTKLDSGLQTSISAGAQNVAGQFYLFSQAGHMLRLTADGTRLELLPQAQMSPVSGASFDAQGALVLVGNRGVRSLSL